MERPGPPPARRRALSDAEVRWFWRGCDGLGAPYGPLLQFLLLAGARLDEVTGMLRRELGEYGATWTVPGERAKNHRPNLLPLPALARDIVAGAPRISGTDLVFTRTGKVLTGFSASSTSSTPPCSRSRARRTRPRPCRPGAYTTCEEPAAPACTRSAWRRTWSRRCSTTSPAHKAGVAGVYNVAEYRAEKRRRCGAGRSTCRRRHGQASQCHAAAAARQISETPMTNVEATRVRFRPGRITTLFVGESAPASGAFFYRGNTALERHMKTAMAAAGLGGEGDFLDRFRSYGWYLEDLVLEPVDQLPPRERRARRVEAVNSLADRIAKYRPAAIVSLLLSIEDLVGRAARRAGSPATLFAVPFAGHGSSRASGRRWRAFFRVCRG